MAQRRMFSLQIIDTDAFLEMPTSARELYFQLGMRGDDDGFVNNPRRVIRMLGATEDDIRILLAKRFLINFENGIVVIKHWKINNYIQNDRYTATKYFEEMNQLEIKENGSYTEKGKKITSAETKRIQNGYTMDTQVRLGKVSIGKYRLDKNTLEILSNEKFIDELKEKFPGVDVLQEIEKMKDWLAANGKKKKDYAAFARNWLRNVKPIIRSGDNEVVIRPERTS